MFGDFNILPPSDCSAVAAVVSNMRPPEIVAGNARLIAAAPEMLEALLAADEIDTIGLMNATGAQVARARELREAAIAKAEGRAP